VLSWIGATILATGVLAFIPLPETWPLPTGLGGLSGMLFSNLAASVAGAEPQPITAALFAVIIAAPAMALFWIAMGLGTAIPTAPRKARKGAAEDDSVDEREPNPLVEVAIGAVVHMGYSLRTAF